MKHIPIAAGIVASLAFASIAEAGCKIETHRDAFAATEWRFVKVKLTPFDVLLITHDGSAFGLDMKLSAPGSHAYTSSKGDSSQFLLDNGKILDLVQIADATSQAHATVTQQGYGTSTAYTASGAIHTFTQWALRFALPDADLDALSNAPLTHVRVRFADEQALEAKLKPGPSKKVQKAAKCLSSAISR